MTNKSLIGRGGIQRVPEGNLETPALDPLGALLMSQLLPPYAKLAAVGKVFAIDMSGGTAIAPVTAMPTTSPQWGLYNASATEHMIVIRASINLQSGTAGLGLSIVGAAARGVQTLVSADYAGTLKTPTNGSAGQGPSVFLDDNPTLVGGTPAWFAFEGTKVNTVATDSVGDTIVAPVDGLLVAPPGGHMVAFEVVGETGTSALYDFQALIAMVNMS